MKRYKLSNVQIEALLAEPLDELVEEEGEQDPLSLENDDAVKDKALALVSVKKEPGLDNQEG